MAIAKLFLDMDGVLCSFNRRYEELFNESPTASRARKNFSPNWETFIVGQNFATLDWNPGGQELLEFVSTIKNVEIEILSSSGGQKHHAEVTKQKTIWLCEHGIPYKANIVPGSRLKAEHASPFIALVDDTDYVIDGFVKAGGIGILHSDVKETIEKIKSVLP